jgi:hypothetical protein
MRLFLTLVLVTPLWAQAPKTITGQVVDSFGKPLEGARIDYVKRGWSSFGPSTDAQGRFRVEMDTPAAVIRKPGFQSYFVRPADQVQLQVTLQPAKAPKCTPASVPDVVVKEVRDSDYTATYKILNTKDGPRALVSGKGSLWSYGIPVDSDVWNSVEYFEENFGSFANDGIGTVDARGKTAAGRYWRYRGSFGYSTSYHDVDQSTALLMDRLIDGGDCQNP